MDNLANLVKQGPKGCTGPDLRSEVETAGFGPRNDQF